MSVTNSNTPVKQFAGNDISKHINAKHLPDSAGAGKVNSKFTATHHTDKYPHKEGTFVGKTDTDQKIPGEN